uniref:Metallo-beta-lactamase domain-containing protein n=1 Tax=Amphimedon queenslandica TaxID=400682 RepID=A0A1X7TZV8_AMPQE
MQNFIIILSLLLKVAVSIEPIPDADDELHIYALPVGQGDCTVIQCPRGQDDPVKGTVSIIDAGSSTEKLGMKGKDIVDFLKGTELRLAVLTHSDADHLKYMNRILNFYNNKKVPIYHSCEWNKHYTKHISKKYTNCKEIPRCMSIKQCSKKLDLCPRYKPKFGVTLFFVASAVGKCTGHRANNADSLIAKITYAGRSILIAGDFELPQKEMKKFLKLKGVKDGLRSHIYRLSHHGAYNSKANRYEFLDAVGASYVFSSSGFRYHHPRCEIYNYYQTELFPDIVAEHPYTCFYQHKIGDFTDYNPSTTKAIYVTHIYKKGTSFIQWFISYYLLRFDIDRYGGVSVDFKLLGETRM